MIQLSVVIVNYNSSFFIQLCLDALKLAINDISHEVIVVDNLSTDDSCEVIIEKYPWVKLIMNDENIGFGRANNIAIRQALGRHILLLNPDTLVSKQSISDSLKRLGDSSDIGAVGVKMIDGSGAFLPESKRGLPTPMVAFYKSFGLTRCFPKSKIFAHYYLGHLPENEVSDIEVLAGAFIMAKAEVLHACKGFDEDFFMYGEDIDLSYRITKMGWRIVYLPDSPIVHFKGECAGHDAVWASRFYEAMELFTQKHFASKGWLLNRFVSFGISLRKKFASNTTPVRNVENDLSRLKLLYVTDGSGSLSSEFKSRFACLEIVSSLDDSVSDFEAIVFGPHTDRGVMIDVMQSHAGQKAFFFLSRDGDFALSSPSSENQGVVYQ